MDKTTQRARWKRFLGYYRPHRKIFIFDLCCATLNAAAALAFPLLCAWLANTVLTQGGADVSRQTLTVGLALLGLCAVRIACDMAYSHWGHAMGARMEGAMREELFAHLERMPFSFFSRESVGGLLTVLSNDLTNMTELFHHGPEDLLMTLIKFVGAVVVLLNLHLRLALLVLATLPPLAALTLWAHRRLERAQGREREGLTAMDAQAEDILSGIRTVKATGTTGEAFARFQGMSRAYVTRRCEFYGVEARFYAALSAYPQVLTMLVVVGGALMLPDSIGAAALIAFLLYAGTLTEPLQTVLNFMRLYAAGKTSFARFMALMERRSELPEPANPVALPTARGEMRFEHVSFTYEGQREPVFEDLSLHVAAGETLAVVGASGIGKTTLGLLAARFYDPCAGRVTLDGVDLRQLDEQTLRRHIAVVQQEVYLFQGAIRDNLCLGCADVTEQDMRQAAAQAGAAEFIEALATGYDTPVGVHGVLLSGGQRQRIALARALLRRAPVLILDEATSALDTCSERLVQDAIAQAGSATRIVIAHRLSTVRQADRILVLSDGGIAEEGTHEELLRLGGAYARLWAADR
ncbi:MAG: ABC transporter ATP-binding protein [Eubacteriales bacterium]|nr:ABC transporter ATP-binding protein [Eubacteriales bacterium]